VSSVYGRCLMLHMERAKRPLYPSGKVTNF
jgi:hypothetical protein